MPARPPRAEIAAAQPSRCRPSAELRSYLDTRRTGGLYRARRIIDGPQGPQVNIDGRPYLAFCSNDYLGLAAHPEVVAALQAGAADCGAGSGAAHLISGHHRVHHQLEEELAEFVGRPRALLFSTGYMANLGTVDALVGRGDHVFADRLDHASLLDAGRLSGARLHRYPHAQTDALGTLLARYTSGSALIATDGVFSMDGDVAPLPALAALARDQHADLLVDDAHGLGVLGAGGRGSLEHFGLGMDDVPILIGTLGKAFGTFGAFVAGSEELIETLIQRARTFVYTTALPPAVAQATRASLRLLRAESWRREHLRALVHRFRGGARQLGLPLLDVDTPIQPLMVGNTDAAQALSAALFERGILINAIRPPTVPEGSARLRITFSAAHQPSHVDRLLEVLGSVSGWEPAA